MTQITVFNHANLNFWITLDFGPTPYFRIMPNFEPRPVFEPIPNFRPTQNFRPMPKLFWPLLYFYTRTRAKPLSCEVASSFGKNFSEVLFLEFLTILLLIFRTSAHFYVVQCLKLCQNILVVVCILKVLLIFRNPFHVTGLFLYRLKNK